MKTGRLTQEEHDRRLKLLLRFIYMFRYALRSHLITFIKEVIKINSTQWLIDNTVKDGYISVYKELSVKAKIYYLTQKAKDFLSPDEPLIGNYRFEKTHAGINTFQHHNALVESYFLLRRCLEIKEWIPEGVLRTGARKQYKVPDGLLKLASGQHLALEIETTPKNLKTLKRMAGFYKYDLDKILRYSAVLVIAASKTYYEYLKEKFQIIAPDLFERKFILTSFDLLAQGGCFYQGEVCLITEAINRIGRDNDGEEC